MTGRSERDDITLRLLAIAERTTVAEQRRRALAAHAAGARADPWIAEAVRLVFASRRDRQRRRAGNVVSLTARGREVAQ